MVWKGLKLGRANSARVHIHQDTSVCHNCADEAPLTITLKQNNSTLLVNLKLMLMCFFMVLWNSNKKSTVDINTNIIINHTMTLWRSVITSSVDNVH